MSTPFLPRDHAGRFAGHGAFTIETPQPPTLFTPLGDAEARLRSSAFAAVDVLLDKAAVDEAAPIPIALLAASPGAGKSRVAREVLGECAGREEIAFHAPTLSLSEEAADHARELGGTAHVIRGRLAPDPEDPARTMCLKPELVQRGSRLGLNIRKSFCDDGAARCPHADSCAYMRQFQPPATAGHRYLATNYLGIPEPDSYAPVLRVVDETFWAQQVSFPTVDLADFRMPRSFLKHRAGRGRKDVGRIQAHADLLVAAQQVSTAFESGRSPLRLPYSVEDFREFAALEYGAQAETPSLSPDQDMTHQLAVLTQAEGIIRRASRYAAVWTCLADARERGREICERLRLVEGLKGPALRICRKHPVHHRQPMLVLDADADEEILGALDLDVLQSERMTLRPNAEILQIHDRRMTHGSLLNGTVLRENWRRVIRREVLFDRMKGGGGVLVGASRKVVLRFFRDAGYAFEGKSDEEISRFMLDTPLHGAHWLWFGGRALGTNRYRDCSTVIVIGREELPLDTLEDYGRALWGDRAEADLAFVPPDEGGAVRMPQVAVPYEMADGSAMAVHVPCHPDPLIRRVQIQTREYATRQLVERLRLARSPHRKRVVLGCNIPIPGLPVDQLLSWDAFLPARHTSALVDGLLDGGGLRLSNRGLVEDAVRIFASEDEAKGYRKRQGLSVCDVVSELPPDIRATLWSLTLRRDQPYAREESALVAAATPEEACAHAEVRWGPLSRCEALGAATRPSSGGRVQAGVCAAM
ncbi:hypothetical protein [Sagittula salina]|uniref:Uncharacterized protein n=1 Tax=Sagittula salina TaxID=2820268 RepID=A0A940MV38_9RHOB|nr:hypothetical protein [Sagittula salina]MBP0484512.1 hypothetical protein [Sagittula salina]